MKVCSLFQREKLQFVRVVFEEGERDRELGGEERDIWIKTRDRQRCVCALSCVRKGGRHKRGKDRNTV